jgi:glycosyltransferase involved in cell wall biosynthesis
VLEAKAHGLPCIVADWGGPQLYAARGGLLLSVASPQALEDDLVDKVRLLLSDPALGRSLGHDGRASVDGDYVWRSKAARMHDEMLARSRARA